MNFFDFSFSTLGDPIRDLSAFDCGRKEINKFFQKDALDYQNELFSKTYLLSPRNDLDKVAAAFTDILMTASRYQPVCYIVI
jgi:hypothetical protein